jgi:cobalt-zinc-cadmium efflux system protein
MANCKFGLNDHKPFISKKSVHHHHHDKSNHNFIEKEQYIHSHDHEEHVHKGKVFELIQNDFKKMN